MKSDLEKKLCAARDSATTLVEDTHGDDAVEIICSFSELDCFADVKLDGGDWVRYALMYNGDDEPDTLQRIG
jgi:hypothetical protein